MQSKQFEQSYYLCQSANTEPGKYAYLFDRIEPDVEQIFQAARNVVEHHAGRNAARIDLKRMADLDINRVEDLLERRVSHGAEDLNVDCALEQKSIGNCLNISKVACSMLRHKGVPARIRYAYCTYFYPDHAHEQTMVEYWNAVREKWLMGDASVNRPVLHERGIEVGIDLSDVSPSLSTPVAQVWQACRRGDDRFERYGNHNRRGLPHVAQKMIQDLACLNNVEMLPWDFSAPAANYWKVRCIDVAGCDALAEKMLNGPWDELLYAGKRLPFFAVPRRILRRSPYSGVSLTYVEDGVWKTK